METAHVAQVGNHCCSRAKIITNTTCLLNKNVSGDQFGWNSAHLVLTGSLTALQQIISTGNYVGWNPGREAAKRFLHSIESLQLEAIQVKRFRRQWNLFSSVILNYNGEGSQRVLDMNANHYGTAADQQLLVFYVRAERLLTFLWEPHQLVTVNVLPHGGFQLLVWREEEVKSVEFLSSWHDKASVEFHEGSWRKEIANNEQKQLMLQFILRQLGNNEKQCRTHRH